MELYGWPRWPLADGRLGCWLDWLCLAPLPSRPTCGTIQKAASITTRQLTPASSNSYSRYRLLCT